MEDLSYLLSTWFWSSRLRSVSHQLNQGDEAETQAQEQRNATVKEIFDRLDVPGLSFSVCEFGARACHTVYLWASTRQDIWDSHAQQPLSFFFFSLFLSLSISIYVDNMSKIFWADAWWGTVEGKRYGNFPLNQFRVLCRIDHYESL